MINIGAPAGGMSTAVRAFVRFSLFNGHSVLGIRDGIDGLLQDKVLSILLSNSQRECGRVSFSMVKTLLLDFLKVLIFYSWLVLPF